MNSHLKEWLIEHKTSEGKSVPKCKFCHCVLASKLCDLKLHASTKKHKENAQAFSTGRQPTLPFKSLKKVTDSQIAEGRMAMFVAAHTAVSTCDHLNNLCKGCFTDSKTASMIQMKRSKCSGIIKNILYPHFMRDVTDAVGDRHYSLLIDESTDISVHKYLGMAIIYHDDLKGKIISTFLSLSELEECNAAAIVGSLKATLEYFGLNLKKLRGIGTDNASVMVGINNGVYQKLKAEVPNLILIRCVCHSLQLSVSAATAEALPRNLEFLVSETYNWFARSSSRQVTYKKIYNLINDDHDPMKIVQACETRWLSIATAVERIYSQWLELKTHFDMARTTEKCYTAEMLSSMFNDARNLAYIKFMLPIVKDIQRVNKAFESNDADPTKLLNDLVLLVKSLVNKIVLPTSRVDPLEGNFEEYLDPKPYLGYDFEKEVDALREKGFSSQDEMSLRGRCIKFITVLVKEIRQRLPNNVRILEQISLLSVDKALHAVKEPLTSLLELLQIPSYQIGVIENQWQNITLIKWKEVNNTISFWSEVNNYRDASNCNPLKELADFALSVLVLPHSNGEVERVFSQMNIVKNKLRNRMETKMVNAILGIRAGLRRNDKCCYNYELPPDVLKMIGTTEAYSDRENQPAAAAAASPLVVASTSQVQAHVESLRDDDIDDPSADLLYF